MDEVGIRAVVMHDEAHIDRKRTDAALNGYGVGVPAIVPAHEQCRVRSPRRVDYDSRLMKLISRHQKHSTRLKSGTCSGEGNE